MAFALWNCISELNKTVMHRASEGLQPWFGTGPSANGAARYWAGEGTMA